MKKLIDFTQIRKPFKIRLGFAKLIDELQVLANDTTSEQSILAKRVLETVKDVQKLSDGFDISEDCQPHLEDIKALLSILFPEPLLKNEIKAAIVPLAPKILYSTDRFKNIFGSSGELLPKEFSSTDDDMMYIYMCTFILASYYGISLQTSNPPVYDIRDSRGVTKYYKSTYNADFMSIRPLKDPPVISDEMITQLKENYEDIDMWMDLFPPESWEASGFGINSFTHISNEEALSRFKNLLIGNKKDQDHEAFITTMNDYVSTLLDVPNMVTSFVMYDSTSKQFILPDEKGESFALNLDKKCDRDDLLCDYGTHQIFENKEDFIISDIDLLPEEAFENRLYANLRDEGIKSYIMTPLSYDGDLLGVLEFASLQNGVLDNTHKYKINQLKDLAINSLKSYIDERENELTSIIQHEFTSIHPSVSWKFREEAEKSVAARLNGENYNIENITFHELTALYGQMDISGSSIARNKAIAADLKSQMSLVRSIIDQISEVVTMPLLQSIHYQIVIICEKLSSDLAAGMEQEVIEFLRDTINPLFQQMRSRDDRLEKVISAYFDQMGEGMEIIYDKRKDYDDTVKSINAHLSGRMDEEQVKAQLIYPHYFERYKTDGVEHNMFIGQEISPTLPYNKLYLDNLRLWQLQTICQLEIEHNNRIKDLPVPLKVASLIMIYSNPLAIRYRMDEKQFDIDGAYNARYEIIKKRIDKAHIKGTKERITQPGKIVMIYTQNADLDEYLNYVHYLTYQGYLTGDPELLDIEELQGVVGLKGLRVSVNYDYKENKSLASKKETKKVTA